MNLRLPALAVLATALVAACSKAPPEAVPLPASAPVAAAEAAPPARRVDAWLGRWQGPEGTFLEITGAPGAYRVTVHNLDGPRSFEASATEAGLSFVRDGVTQTVRAGHGADTGMKWLADKQDCLVVKAGEGYCRG
ncbi:hypothetical protein ACG02S_11575 [Roseateles sp. DC23W]|uniref:Lipoprotein n=1 Tax=Pelomonas dachongensis TaxID=3299029 RepID=A0ABW7ENS2_9BURK